MMAADSFPTITTLWEGAILSTIAHAVAIAADPTLVYERSWDGPNYSRQDSQGTRGTITFVADHVVGVFRDDDSPRAPWHRGQLLSHDTLLHGMPAELRAVAEAEALPYVIDAYDGIDQPIITTAFWSVAGVLTAADPWPTVVTHGGYLIAREVLPRAAALAAWQDECAFTADQRALVARLSDRRLAPGVTTVPLTPADLDALVALGDDGRDEALEALTAIGFVLP